MTGKTTRVTLPQRDENRRKLYRMLLGMKATEANKLTVEQLENRCLKLGFLEITED